MVGEEVGVCREREGVDGVSVEDGDGEEGRDREYDEGDEEVVGGGELGNEEDGGKGWMDEGGNEGGDGDECKVVVRKIKR